MWRGIEPLFNLAPPASEADIRAAAVRAQGRRLQPAFGREREAFGRLWTRSAGAERLMGSLVIRAQARDREVEAEKARERGGCGSRRGGERCQQSERLKWGLNSALVLAKCTSDRIPFPLTLPGRSLHQFS